MEHRRSAFIDVEELMRQVSVEQAAAYYGVALPEFHRIGDEIRTKCFLNCRQAHETGDRSLAIKADDPAKKWRCHHYGCGRGGNLVSLCDLMKAGEHMEGRPRGDRFKQIARDLQAMAGGGIAEPEARRVARPAEQKAAPPVERNVPLAASENERARALVNLDQKLLVDPAAMTPKAASYFRRRPYLTPEVCKRWRMGYLGRDAGGDRAGGTMRGKVIYAYQSEEGEVLTWFGRDPEHEDKHRQWLATGKQGSEPEKFHFVKGFHRGLELFGQDRFVAEMRRREAEGEGVEQSPLLPTGLIVVEGPNDVIRMGTLGEPAVGLCSNTVTREQAVKIARLSAAYAGGHVALMLDCDSEGENGARQALWEITQHGAAVRLVWSRGMHGGRFADRQPESCSPEEWAELRQAL